MINAQMSMNLIISTRRILCMGIQNTNVRPKQTRPLSPTFLQEQDPGLEQI